MADINVIKQIKATDGTVYELDAKYWNGRTYEEVFQQVDAMVYRGVISFDDSSVKEQYTPSANKGDVYKVSVKAGMSGCKVNGILVDNGDMFICNSDDTPAANSSDTQPGKWDVIQSNIDASGLATATHIHTYTPEGTISTPEFTGTQVESLSGKASITSTVTDGGHSHGIEYNSVSVSANEQATSVAASDHKHAFTPAGSVDVALTDNGHHHSVTAAGTVAISQSKNATASSETNGLHSHTIELNNVDVIITDDNHKHTATVTQGTAAAQVFTGTEVETKATEDGEILAAAQTHVHAVSATGTAAAQVFTGIAGETETDAVNVVEVSKSSHTHTYKPEGTVSGSFTGSKGVTSSISGTVNVAADAHKHGGALKAVVSSNVLTFSLDGEVNASTAKTAVATSTHTHEYTPTGSLSDLAFSGTEATIGATDKTNIAKVSTESHKHAYTPSGSNAVSAVSVTGTASATTTDALSVAGYGHTHKVTAAGKNAASAVSGTAVTISEVATGIKAKFSVSATATSEAGGHTHTINLTQPEYTATFTGSAVNTVSATTGLSASATFTGEAAFTNTPNSTVNVAALEHSHNYDKATTIVSAATGITVASVDAGHTHKVTAAGNVSTPEFTGKSTQTSGPETAN